MGSATYLRRRGELETYFDRTASDAWAKLTSDAPVSGIRATVRAGRDRMRQTLLDWLPADLRGARILDAGCGPGQFSVEMAKRGADVLAVDLSPTLLGHARNRIAAEPLAGSVTFVAGDMLDDGHGEFDFAVAMDSLIHYPAGEIVQSLGRLAGRTRQGVLFTFAPRTVPLTIMHAVGGLFPKGDRAPAIEPVAETDLRRRFASAEPMDGWSPGRTAKISSGFYISAAMELRHA